MFNRALASLCFLLLTWLFSFWPNLLTLYKITPFEVFIFNVLILALALYVIYKKSANINLVAIISSQLGLLGLGIIITIWIIAGVTGLFHLQTTSILLMLPAIVLIALGPYAARLFLFPLLYLLLIIPFYENTLNAQIFLWWLAFGLMIAYLRYQNFSSRVIIVAISVIIPLVIQFFPITLPTEILVLLLSLAFVALILFWHDKTPLYGIGDVQLQPGKDLIESRARFLIPTIIGCSMMIAAPWLSDNIRSFYPKKSKAIVLQAPRATFSWAGPVILDIDWTPEFVNPTATLKALYQKQQSENVLQTANVYLFAVYYQSDRTIDDLLNPKNRLYNQAKWQEAQHNTYNVSLTNNYEINVNETILKNAGNVRVIWSWYYILGVQTIDVNMMQFLDKIRLISKYADGSGLIAVATDNPEDIDQARNNLASFVKEMYPALELLQRPEKLQ